MTERSTLINGLRRISELKGVLPQNDRTLCKEAADRLEADGMTPAQKDAVLEEIALYFATCANNASKGSEAEKKFHGWMWAVEKARAQENGQAD